MSEIREDGSRSDSINLIGVNKLAYMLDVSHKTIYSWVYSGRIPFYKMGPKLLRFDLEKVKESLIDLGKSNTK